MAEQNQDNKTEAPTYKRLQDARKEGNVAKSRDLSMFVSVSVLLLSLVIMHNYLITNLYNIYDVVFFTIKEDVFTINKLLSVIIELFIVLFKLLIPLIIVSSLSAGLCTLIQLNGFLFATKVFKFDLQKFNVVNNFKELFSKKNLIKFFANICKIIIIGYIGYLVVVSSIRNLSVLANLRLPMIILFLVLLIIKLIVILLGIFAIFSIIDFVLEKRAKYKKLMMSMDEVKKDYKETEGNPEIKGKRKELHRELLEDDDMFGNYKDSMFVLANPTHIAVVILYKPTKWKLPIVVMKSKGYMAQTVFRIAKRNEVPIIRDKWIARQLFAFAEVNQIIPKSMIKVVATLIGNNLHLLPKIAEEINLVKQGVTQMMSETPFDIKSLNLSN